MAETLRDVTNFAKPPSKPIRGIETSSAPKAHGGQNTGWVLANTMQVLVLSHRISPSHKVRTVYP